MTESVNELSNLRLSKFGCIEEVSRMLALRAVIFQNGVAKS